MQYLTIMGKWLTQNATKIFPLFKNEYFAPSLAGLIGILAVCILIKFIVRYFLPAWMQLHGCIKLLKSYSTWEDFSKGFGDFDLYMLQKAKVLRHGWEEFKKTIIPPNDGESRPIWITVRPSLYFNIADTEHHLGLRSFQAWSNILVGLGLLLTFLGLVAALFFASEAIRSAVGIKEAASVLKNGVDAQKAAQAGVQDALVQLLNTASFKFWTSIAGLGCSILLTLVHKWLSKCINHQFVTICGRIENLTQIVTPEWLANRQYEAVQEQSNQLKNFNDQLAFTLGKALETAIQQAMPSLMATAMSPVIERLDSMPQSNGETFRDALSHAMPPVMESAIAPLADQMGNMIEKLNETNQSAVQSLTQKFGDVVTANAGTELKELATTLGQVRETLSATSQSVTGSGSEMSRQLSEATLELRSVMKSLVEMVEKMSHGVESDLSRTQSALQIQLASVGDNLDALANGIKISLNEMGGQLTTSSMKAAEAFNEEIAGAVRRIEAAAESGAASLEALVDSLRTAAQDATGSLANETAGASRVMQEAVERMATSMDSASRAMLNGASEASDVISSRLLDSISDLKEATRQNALQIREAVEAIIGAGSAARQDVGEAVHRVSVDLDEKGQAAANKLVSGATIVLDNLSNTVDGLNARANGLISALEDIENKLGVHAVVLRGLNDSTRSTADVMAGTAKTLKDSTVPLAQTEQGLLRVSDALRQSVERLFDHMEPIQRELARLSRETAATLEKLQGIWGQYEKRFENVDSSLGKTVESIINNLKGNASSFSEYVRNVDSHLAKTVGQLAGNIEELSHTAEELRKSTEIMHNGNSNSVRVSAKG